MEQNNIRAALDVYDNGIKSMISLMSDMENNTAKKNTEKQNQNNGTAQRWSLSSKKKKSRNTTKYQQIQQDLLILKTERQSTFTTLLQNSYRFHHSIPSEILYKIFGYLDQVNDFWQCMHVCKRWCYFSMTFSPFWNQLSHIDTPPNSRSTAMIIDRHKSTHALYLNGPLNPNIPLQTILDILQLISDNNHNIVKLGIKSIKFTDNEAERLGNILNRMKNPPLKHVEFIECKISDDKIISTIIESCSAMSRITFEEESDSQWITIFRRGIYENKLRKPIVPFLSLT
ncbi:hypothetical protein BDA99DRAFT_492464 [Phascolomyces articulosus]|uniref:F-box domain-containing protein n=1 Tax=Phascolomyces articulosus TaxID=60185 RepID=A0AAD5KC15_9FUNG|nr:hypothetical protein BDA99DRAFT_492464 [Phascolomyces articulosus]